MNRVDFHKGSFDICAEWVGMGEDCKRDHLHAVAVIQKKDRV